MKTQFSNTQFRPLALLTGLRSDSHTWPLVYMHLLLEEKGFEVINLGATTPIDEVLEVVDRHDPEILVISTVNGHGLFEGKQIAAKLGQSGKAATPKVIGGLLTTDPAEVPAAKAELEKFGYDGVFTGDSSVAEFITFLNELLAKQKQASLNGGAL